MIKLNVVQYIIYSDSCVCWAQSDMEAVTEFPSDSYLHPSVYVKQEIAAVLCRKNSRHSGWRRKKKLKHDMRENWTCQWSRRHKIEI